MKMMKCTENLKSSFGNERKSKKDERHKIEEGRRNSTKNSNHFMNRITNLEPEERKMRARGRTLKRRAEVKRCWVVMTKRRRKRKKRRNKRKEQ